MSFKNTQLSNPFEYDVSRIIFSKPQKYVIPNTKPPISSTRIYISTKNKDGSVGDLIFETSTLFSFGISENTDPSTGKINGYVMPLCMWNKDGASDEEKKFTDTFDKVIQFIKNYILEIREDLEKYDLNENSDSLKKLNPMYWKRVKGKIVEGAGPVLYVKLMQSKKNDKIMTDFFNESGEEIDHSSLIGKYCYSKAALKIESINVGKNISVQVKLYEANVRLLETGKKRLLPRPQYDRNVTVSEDTLPLVDETKEEKTRNFDNIEDDDTGSINGSDDEKPVEPEPEPQPEVQKKVVKKVVVRKVTKST
jgi:hypothetical protein